MILNFLISENVLKLKLFLTIISPPNSLAFRGRKCIQFVDIVIAICHAMHWWGLAFLSVVQMKTKTLVFGFFKLSFSVTFFYSNGDVGFGDLGITQSPLPWRPLRQKGWKVGGGGSHFMDRHYELGCWQVVLYCTIVQNVFYLYMNICLVILISCWSRAFAFRQKGT